MEKAKHFYDILAAKDDSYNILRDALQQTGQSGALEVLNDALLTDVLKELEVPLSKKNEFKCNIDAVVDTRGNTLVHLAASTKRLQQLEQLKHLNANLEIRNLDGFTPLFNILHCLQHFTETLYWFSDQKVNLQAVDNSGNNLVLMSALNRLPATKLKQIIECGVNWETENESGQTVMHLAAQGGNIEALEYFKSLGADVSARDKYGNTPFLQLSVAEENFSVTFNN